MTQNDKIRETLELLRRLLKYEKETTKIDLYWNLLTECMNKEPKYAEYLGDKWEQYLTERVAFLDRRKEYLKEMEKKENSKQT